MHTGLEAAQIVDRAYRVEQVDSTAARTVEDHMKMTYILFRIQECEPADNQLDFYEEAIA